jgi:transposase-like protein
VKLAGSSRSRCHNEMVATGVNVDGFREILGVTSAPPEAAALT